MRTIKTAHIDLASLNPLAERVQVHLANGWTGDLRSVSYDNNLQEFTLDMSGFVQKYNRGGMHSNHPFLNVVSLTIEVQDVPAVKPGLWAQICGRVGRCISIPIDFSGEKQGGLVPKDFPCEGLVHRGRDLQRAEAERLGVKVELNVPPVPYCGLMNPEAFARLKVCDQKDKGAPWEINNDK